MRQPLLLSLVVTLAGVTACDKARDLLGLPDAGTPQVPTGDPTGGPGGPIVGVRLSQCTPCHGTPGLELPNADPLVSAAPPRSLTGPSDPGVHRSHLVDGPFRRAVECASCHLLPADPAAHPTQAQGKVSFSRLATTPPAWTGAPSTPVWNGTTCAGTYCHGNFKNGANATPAWTAGSSTVACGSCHAVSATNGPGGTHPSFGGGQHCGSCHGGAYTNTAVDLSLHMNGVVDAGNLNCSTCHGDGTRLAVASATALDALGGNLVRASPPIDAGHGAAATGAHLAHVNQGDGAAPGPLSNAIACAACHAVPSSIAHSNGTEDVVFGGLATAGGATPAPYALATHTCASTYCHGSFTGGAGANPLAWTGTTKLGCTSCHGAPPGPASATVHHPPNPSCGSCHAGYTGGTVAVATHVNGTVEHAPASGCTQCHGDLTAAAVANTDVRAAPGSDATAVDAHGNGSGVIAARGVGAHGKHLTGTTWRAQPIACGECHTVPAAGDVSHGNGDALVVFGALASNAWSGEPAITPTWNGAGGATTLTCASVYCHGAFRNGANATLTWASPSTVSCGTCHGVSATNGPGGTHPTLSAGQSCGSCHGGSYTNTSVDLSLHMNGVLDGVGHPIGWKEPDQHGLAALGGLAACTACHVGYGPSSGGASSSCDGCHATPSVYGPYATGTYPDHANWQTECTFCHGGRSGDTTGAPPRNTHVISTSTTPQPTTDATIGAHVSHVAATHAVSAPLDCTACHQTRWTSATDVGHVDKATADVFFNAVGPAANPGAYTRPTCSSTYCHGSFTGGAGSGSLSWTGTFGGAFTLSCSSCHALPPGPVSASVHHPPNTACGACHAGYTASTVSVATHVDGRVDHTPATGCTQCHGDITVAAVANTDVRAAPGSDAAAVDAHGNTSATTGARGVGAHAKHLTGTTWRATPIPCAECHAVPATGDVAHANGNPLVTFGALARTAWGGQPAITPAWNGAGGAANLTCSSTYCHGAFKNGANAVPTWATPSAVTCGSCHAVSATNGAGGTHPTFGAGQNCGSCHGGTYSNTTVDPALHLNGALDVANLTCSTCHGDSTRLPVASAGALDALGANLVKASPPVDAGHGTAATGAHLAHVNQDDTGAPGPLSSAMACTTCHVVPTSTSHSDGTVAVTFGGLATTGGATPTAYNFGTHGCASTYCHGNFAGGSGANPILWTATGKLGCTSCHGNPPPVSAGHPQNDACASCHGTGYAKAGAASGTVNVATHVNGTVDLVAAESCTSCHGTPGRASAAGADVYQTAAPPSDTRGLQLSTAVGAHLAHSNASRPTPLASPVACAVCHPVPAQNRHADGSTQVVFTGVAVTGGITGASYASPSCSATYCHGNFPGGAGVAAAPAWDSTGGQLACNACHGAPPGPTSATVHHPPNPGCASCHANYTATTVTAATHVNGVVDHTPATGCTQCHGDLTVAGVPRTDVRAAPGSDAAAVDAHGNTSATTSARGVGAHGKHLTGTTWRATPIACAECHAVPAAGDVAHANGNALVTFGPLAGTAWSGEPAITPVWNGAGGAATLTCTSVYCHGAFKNGQNAAPTWATPSVVACGSCHLVSLTNGPGGTHPTLSAGQTCGTCHGGSYTNSSVDPALHMNGVLDGGGESGGGSACGGCHVSILNAMNGTVTPAPVSRHGLASDAPADSGITWASPLSANAAAVRSCVNMCHGDHPHDLVSPATATHENNAYLDATSATTRADGTANRIGVGGTGGTPNRTKSDYDVTQASGGMCVSCHRNPVDAARPAVTKAGFDAAAHHYSTNAVGATTYTWSYTLHDGGLFARDCTKCHASSAEGTTPQAPGTGVTAVHFSDNASLLSGKRNPGGTAAGFVCYNCHGSAATPAAGAQGNRSGKDIQSQIVHATTAGQSGHPANSDSVHDSAAEYANATFGNALGVAAGAGQRHASCLDCHDPHEAKVGTHAQGTNLAGPPLQGAWGARWTGTLAAWGTPTSANFTKTVIAAGTDLEATLCFKCHSAYYGTLPTSPSSSPSFAETDQAKEFNPANASFHPVLASASGKLGVTGNVVAPWTTTSLMTCTDCHESDVTADPNGPHGSAARFILKGPNTTWNGTLALTGGNMPAGTFCANCHAASFAGSRYPAHTNGNHTGVTCLSCHAAIPHGGPRPGMLVNAAGTANTCVPTGGVIAGWDTTAPYFGGPASNRLCIKSYPANSSTNWDRPNCGCNGSGH